MPMVTDDNTPQLLTKEQTPLNNILFRAIPDLNSLTKITEGFDKVTIFIDFNNCIRGMYYTDTMISILEYITQNNSSPDTLVREWGKFQNYLENWAQFKDKKLKTIYFSETGQSYYHKNLLSSYKAGRNQQLFQLPESVLTSYGNIEKVQEAYRNFKHISWNFICSIAKHCNIGTFLLHHIDADFLPEYLFRKADFFKEDTAYVIISSDGDMIQTLDLGDNIFILNGSEEITYSNWTISKSYLRKAFENTNLSPTPDKIILFKAIVGDSSDKIKGIPKIGPKAFINDIVEHVPDDVRGDDLVKLKSIFESVKNKSTSKILEHWETFEICVKLVSFNHLIEHLYSSPSKLDELKEVVKNTVILNENSYSNFVSYIKNI